MPTVAELVREIADATGEPLPTVRMMARRLMDDDVLPKSSGRRVPLVTHEHAASLLLAVLAAPAVKEATRTALAYGALTYRGGNLGKRSRTALEAVTRLLTEIPKEVDPRWWSLEVCTSWREITVRRPVPGPQTWTPDGLTMSESLYLEPGKDPLLPQSYHLKRLAIASGICLYAIGCALVPDQ